MKKTYSSPELERVLFPVEAVLAVSIVNPGTPGSGSTEVSPSVDIFRSNEPNKVF